MNSENENQGKEQRQYLYLNNKEEYKKERKKFKCGVSKTFRDLRNNKKEELEFLEEQSKLANELEENGEKE